MGKNTQSHFKIRSSKSNIQLNSSLVWIVQMVICAICFMGENARQVFYFLPQHYISYIIERKWQVGLMALFIGTQISNFISSTGAFEIFVDNKQIWSRLSTNNVPSFEYLVDRISKLGYSLTKY